MSHKKHAWYALAGKIIFAAGLLYAIKDQFDWSSFNQIVMESPSALIAIPIGWIINQYLISLRLWYLLRSVQIEVPLRDVIRSTFGSLLISAVIPGVVGADVSRVVMLRMASREIRLASLSAMVVFDRLLGLIVLLVVSSLAAYILGEQSSFLAERIRLFFLAVGFVAAGALPLVALVVRAVRRKCSGKELSRFAFLPPTIQSVLRRVLVPTELSFKVYLTSVLVSVAAVGALLLPQVLIGQYLCVASAAKVAPVMLIHLLPTSVIASVIPITPLGIGISQVALSELFHVYGLPTAVAINVVSVSQLGQVIVGVAIGVPAVLLQRTRGGPQVSQPCAL
jgi:uncharacterized protein (TIRG00374 family)